MKISSAINVVRAAIRDNRPLMLKGRPGCAKTEGIRLACQLENIPLHICHPVSWDVCDGRGLPGIVNNVAEFLPFGDLRRMNSATAPMVVFFDDLGQSAQMVQALIMQIVQEREINGVSISDFVRFVFATNNRKDAAGVAGILTPLINRLTVIEIQPDAADWVAWGKNHNIPIELLGFLTFRPELICDFDPVKHKDAAFASPRSWEMLANWIHSGITEFEVWEGTIGTACAVEFRAYWEAFTQLRGIPEMVEKNPMGAMIPNRPDLVFALSNALARRATKQTLPNIYRYFRRLDSEFTVSGMIAISQLHPELMETPEMVDFQIRSQNSI